jgi:hypothetical protein
MLVSSSAFAAKIRVVTVVSCGPEALRRAVQKIAFLQVTNVTCPESANYIHGLSKASSPMFYIIPAATELPQAVTLGMYPTAPTVGHAHLAVRSKFYFSSD